MDAETRVNVVSKAAYARAKSVNRSTITRWADQDRIVLDDAGNVLVAESEAQLAATADPSKAGVVKRHEIERGQAVMDLVVPTTDAAPGAKKTKAEKPEGYNKRVNESARREAAEADMAELRRDAQLGKLTDVEGMQKAMVEFATLVRQTYERVAFELKHKAIINDAQFADLKAALHAAATKVSDTLTAQLESPANTQQ